MLGHCHKLSQASQTLLRSIACDYVLSISAIEYSMPTIHVLLSYSLTSLCCSLPSTHRDYSRSVHRTEPRIINRRHSVRRFKSIVSNGFGCALLGCSSVRPSRVGFVERLLAFQAALRRYLTSCAAHTHTPLHYSHTFDLGLLRVARDVISCSLSTFALLADKTVYV